MNNFYDDHISRSRRIGGLALSILFSLQLFIGGVMKLIQASPVVANFESLPNFGDKILVVGILELALLFLYWVPATKKLGFYLLCSFVGGIICAEVVIGNNPTVGVITAILLYIGTFLRYPSLLNKGGM